MADFPGDLVRVSALVTVSGNPIDPTSASATVRRPDGTTSTVTPTRDAAGTYHVDIAVSDNPAP